MHKIERIYRNKSKPEHYVYVYFTIRTNKIMLKGNVITIDKGVPYYVGKGKGKRAFIGRRNANTERFIEVFGKEIKIMEQNLTSYDAEELERQLIQSYYQQKHILTNQNYNSRGLVEALKHRNIKIDWDNIRGHFANRYHFQKYEEPI